VSLGYVWTLVWSRIFFKEPVTKSKFAALGLILFGIILIAGAG
jgi:multidrug transporter EmrE-like cation transporter